jgi:glycosyltransferase involved in cell wall biosynthesis
VPSTLRLAILAPRFWPHWGDAERRWLALAEGLLAAGHRVTVASPRWRRAWPVEMCVGPVPLVRLRGSHKSGWSTLRWAYSLSRWLREQAGQLDGVLVGGLRHEAYVAIRALADRDVPVVALAGEWDVAWHQSATFGIRIARRCQRASAIVAPSRTLAAQLLSAGFAQEKIVVIPWSVEIPPPRSPAQREAARMALAGVNSDLVTTDATPLGLAIGRLDAEHRFSDLVRAWRIVTANRPEARLWIIGDGPDRERLYRQICDLDLRYRVLIPGTFDCLDELFAAADLYLQPGACEAPPLALLSALAAGLPVVAADAPALREAIEPDQNGLVVRAGEPKALAAQIERLLSAPADGVALGAAARETIRNGPTAAQVVAELVKLLP